ncbi:MAG TPA: hypothetical protein VF508_01990, partial [Pyrinomonadaceae bacterium]
RHWVVHCLLQIREEIKKLASGHISHRAALRLGKKPLFANFLEKKAGDGRPAVRVTENSNLPGGASLRTRARLPSPGKRLNVDGSLS